MKTYRSLVLQGLLALLIVALVGCTGGKAPEASESAKPISVVDDAGRTVEIAKTPQRIISLAPSNTEILFALGLGDKVVGVTDFCDYPEEAKAIEQIGTYFDPNIEIIFSISPDLVLAIADLPEDVIAKLEELDIPAPILAPPDLEGILANIQLVGKATGAEKEAEALVSEMRGRIAAVTEKASEVKEKPRVFCEIDATDPSKPWASGPGSFMDAMIRLSGGTNVAADAESPWPQLSAEEIIAQDPDIIILADSKYGVTAESVGERPGWEVITAVKEGAIFDLDDDLISRPGPRIIDGLEAVARIIHPELFE